MPPRQLQPINYQHQPMAVRLIWLVPAAQKLQMTVSRLDSVYSFDLCEALGWSSCSAAGLGCPGHRQDPINRHQILQHRLALFYFDPVLELFLLGHFPLPFFPPNFHPLPPPLPFSRHDTYGLIILLGGC